MSQDLQIAVYAHYYNPLYNNVHYTYHNLNLHCTYSYKSPVTSSGYVYCK